MFDLEALRREAPVGGKSLAVVIEICQSYSEQKGQMQNSFWLYDERTINGGRTTLKERYLGFVWKVGIHD